MIRIFWAGDSTVKTNSYLTYPQTGIGQVFDRYVKQGVVICNHAENGRSTKSFIEEGRLERLAAELEAGDFLFIQFGHNDEKKSDLTRFTEPFGQFITNLGIFAKTARENGAFPVFISPVERRKFEENGILAASEHTDYLEGMKEAARQFDVPLIDLCSMSRELLQEAGSKTTASWFMHLMAGEYDNYPQEVMDDTHLKEIGALKFGALIAHGLSELGGVYRELLI